MCLHGNVSSIRNDLEFWSVMAQLHFFSDCTDITKILIDILIDKLLSSVLADHDYTPAMHLPPAVFDKSLFYNKHVIDRIRDKFTNRAAETR